MESFRSPEYDVGTGLAVSYGLVILFITIGISYPTFSALLEGTISPSLLGAAKIQFINGFRIATISLAFINSIAIIPSAIRGSKSQIAAGARERAEKESLLKGEKPAEPVQDTAPRE